MPELFVCRITIAGVDLGIGSDLVQYMILIFLKLDEALLRFKSSKCNFCATTVKYIFSQKDRGYNVATAVDWPK